MHKLFIPSNTQLGLDLFFEANNVSNKEYTQTFLTFAALISLTNEPIRNRFHIKSRLI